MSRHAASRGAGVSRSPVSRLARGLAACLLAFLFVACGGGGGGGGSAPPAPALAITAQPGDLAVATGAIASFQVSVNVAATYQWQRQDGSAWVAIAGATEAVYSIASAQVADNGERIRVVVTAVGNAASTLASSAVTLSVAAAPRAPVIVVAPTDLALVEGVDGALSVTATGTSLGYRWQRSTDGAQWSLLAGETGSSLLLAAVSSTDSGKHYRAVGSNASGQVESPGATLTVAPQPVAAAIAAAPTDTSVGIGGVRSSTHPPAGRRRRRGNGS